MKSKSIQNSIDYTLFSWSKQAGLKPIDADKAKGVYVYDKDGKRYLDFSSQLMNVNIGHGNQRITENRMNLEDLNIARMNSTSADSNENTNTNNNSENNMTTTASKIPNFLICGGGINSIKSTTPADNEQQQQQQQPVVCYACPSESQSASEHNA